MDLNELGIKSKYDSGNLFSYYKDGKKTVRKFSDVYDDVRKVRRYLHSRNLTKGMRAGILGKNSYEWVLIDLACLLSGIVSVPLEANGKHDLNELCDVLGLSVVITNLDTAGAAPEKILTFDEITTGAAADNGSGDDLPSVNYGPEDVFTIIFTSGTSGKPKAIEVKKKSFDHLVQGTTQLFEFRPDDKFLVFLPLSIYLERCYIYSAILLHFNIILTPLELVFHAIQKDKPSIIIGVPYFFENFQSIFLSKLQEKLLYRLVLKGYDSLTAIGLGGLVKNRFKPFVNAWGGNIRYLLTGSAPTKKSTLHFYKKMGLMLYEGYGMSEIGGMITLNAPGHTKFGSVGKPFPGKEVVVDGDGQLLVRSPLHANDRYYHSTREDNERTYLPGGTVATGDIGRIDEEGYVYITGRIKDIIITSVGTKIHPTAIEEKIMESGFFKSCMVYGDDKPFITAVLVPKETSATEAEVKEAVKKINTKLSADEKVLGYYRTDTPFTIDNGLLTTSLKLNRKKVYGAYAREIDALYQS